VGRAHRRVCFLRSEGRFDEAHRIEGTELAAAIAEARAVFASDPDTDLKLKGLMDESEERVAEAIAYAEILVPKLAERLNGYRPALPPEAADRTRRSPGREPSGELRGIADFIDEMQAQEHSGAH
jgi:hypothetical protein